MNAEKQKQEKPLRVIPKQKLGKNDLFQFVDNRQIFKRQLNLCSEIDNKCNPSQRAQVIQGYNLYGDAKSADDATVFMCSNVHYFFAQSDMIASANSELSAKGSDIQLIECRKNSKNPAYSLITAERVSTAESGDEMIITSDCGKCCGIVTGDNHLRETYNTRLGEKSLSGEDPNSQQNVQRDMKEWAEMLSETRQRELREENSMFNELCESFKEYTPIEIMKHLTSPLLLNIVSKSSVFSKIMGINYNVAPNIGEGYKIESGGDPCIGHEGGEWNYHWAGVVMESKDKKDKITLENYAMPVEGVNVDNTEWNFEMYGTEKKGQSFHEQHAKSGLHGVAPSTFLVGRVRE